VAALEEVDMTHRYGRLGMSALFVMLAAGGAAAQQPTLARECPQGSQSAGDLGLSGFSCNCTHYISDEHPADSRWQFNSEPTITGVKRDGAANGKLRAGDVIVAIDGLLITTAEGGRHFAQLEPGAPVTLTVRRDGRELTVEITPDADCAAVAPTLAPRTPEAARPALTPAPPSRVPRVLPLPQPAEAPAPAPVGPTLPSVTDMLPRGWLGLSISCSQCGISLNDRQSAPVWDFSSPPIVESVEPESPADRAGIRAGDHITRVDGLAITSNRAGERFGSIRPGQRVTFRIERDGATRDIGLTAGERSTTPPPPAPAPAPPRAEAPVLAQPQPDAMRFSGVLGDALVQVTGAPITVQRTADEIVIRSADITVRIRRTDGGRK
jgi:hypothetical protein